MPTNLLTLLLSARTPAAPTLGQCSLAPLSAANPDEIASLYLASYPPGIAAADPREARQEIADTFRGEFGTLRTDASATAWLGTVSVGAVMVVERSIWDQELEGPFVIELFVSPKARGLGIGRALMMHVVHTCAHAGDARISLRIGEGTSPAALSIYQSLGFRKPA